MIVGVVACPPLLRAPPSFTFYTPEKENEKEKEKTKKKKPKKRGKTKKKQKKRLIWESSDTLVFTYHNLGQVMKSCVKLWHT